MERAQITFQQTDIPFVIKRNARGVNVTIRIDPGGVVHVGAPERATTERIKMIVAEKAPWILEKLAAHGQRLTDLLGHDAARTFCHGDRFLFLGEPLTLALDPLPEGERATVLTEHLPEVQVLRVRGVAASDTDPSPEPQADPRGVGGVVCGARPRAPARPDGAVGAAPGCVAVASADCGPKEPLGVMQSRRHYPAELANYRRAVADH